MFAAYTLPPSLVTERRPPPPTIGADNMAFEDMVCRFNDTENGRCARFHEGTEFLSSMQGEGGGAVLRSDGWTKQVGADCRCNFADMVPVEQ